MLLPIPGISTIIHISIIIYRKIFLKQSPFRDIVCKKAVSLSLVAIMFLITAGSGLILLGTSIRSSSSNVRLVAELLEDPQVSSFIQHISFTVPPVFAHESELIKTYTADSLLPLSNNIFIAKEYRNHYEKKTLY